MIRFVGNNADGTPLKRVQHRRACERCRKRKKRCSHQSQPELDHLHDVQRDTATRSQLHGIARRSSSPQHTLVSGEASQAGGRSDSSPSITQQQTLIVEPKNCVPPVKGRSNATGVDRDDEDHNPRFVGELNPEGIFIASVSPAGATATAATNSPEDVVGIWIPRKLANATKAISAPLLPLLLPYLEDQCFRNVPSPDKYDLIYRLYREEFHPILPIIDLESYQKHSGKNKLLLRLAICLCMASNPRAAECLEQSPKDFSVIATQLLRAAIDNGLVRDKQVTMQLLVVLALATQLSDDRHASAEFTGRVVSYVHTGGFQLDTSVHRDDDAYVTRLFCCVFALDRLNAAVQGRPVLMHERDIGRDLHVCIQQQDNLFQLLLRIVLLLDTVITLYRPALRGGTNADGSNQAFDLSFPAFEDLLTISGVTRAPVALVGKHVAVDPEIITTLTLLATVETFYHAVAMLSCRSQSLSKLARNSSSHIRQSLSAQSITSIAGAEYRGSLSIFPFVPYSLSLALRVWYRELRLSKSSFTRARARRQLLHVCTLLRELGPTFSSSLQMADLAEQLVREMDRAYTNAAGQRRDGLAPALSGPKEDGIQQSQAPQDEGQELHGSAATTTTAIAVDTSPSVNVPSTSNMVDVTQDYDMQTFDPAQFDFDLDIFDHFDPDFDIGAIDAALADIVDPSLSMGMSIWDISSNDG